MRDDFSLKVKDILMKRAKGKCCMCGKETIGSRPNNSNSADIIGEAAHITAATENGPRFDSSIAPVDRQSINNGIWLCRNCHKLVDSNPEKYTVQYLTGIKMRAEKPINLLNNSNSDIRDKEVAKRFINKYKDVLEFIYYTDLAGGLIPGKAIDTVKVMLNDLPTYDFSFSNTNIESKKELLQKALTEWLNLLGGKFDSEPYFINSSNRPGNLFCNSKIVHIWRDEANKIGREIGSLYEYFKRLAL